MSSSKSFLSNLKDYLNNTPKEQILLDWKESEKYDSVGVTVDEFMSKKYDVLEVKILLDKLQNDILMLGENPKGYDIDSWFKNNK